MVTEYRFNPVCFILFYLLAPEISIFFHCQHRRRQLSFNLCLITESCQHRINFRVWCSPSINPAIALLFLHTNVAIGGEKFPPRPIFPLLLRNHFELTGMLW